MPNMFSTQHDYLVNGPEKIHSLKVGMPNTHLQQKCAELVHKASLSLHKLDQSGYALRYGPEPGSDIFQREVAKFLTEQYEDTVNHEDVWANAGASQGLAFIGNALFQPGDVVFADEPMYYHSLGILRVDLKMKVIGVPSDKDGIIIEELEKLLMEYSDKLPPPTEKKPFSAMLYCVPTYNNPTGSSLPVERCKKVIEVLRKHNILAFCDDVYNLLSYTDGKPPPQRLFAFDDKSDADYKGNVISNGSFSKFLAPGLRLGWMELPERVRFLLTTSSYSKGGGCFNNYTSCIIAVALREGLVKDHLLMARKVFHSQRNALCDALVKYIPGKCSYQKPQGGYFVWVTLPSEVDCEKLYAICRKKYFVEFNYGSRFAASVGKFTNCMRLSFSFNESDIIEHCVKQIALALKELLNHA